MVTVQAGLIQAIRPSSIKDFAILELQARSSLADSVFDKVVKDTRQFTETDNIQAWVNYISPTPIPYNTV